MTTRGTPTAQPSPAPKRPSKTASTQSLNHLLNFSLPPRQTQQPPSLPRRSRRNGTQQGVWNKERFVNAQYRFVMNPTGDYTVHFADPDIFFQWHDILQVIIPRNSASASATGGGEGSLQAEGVITCPICLSPPTAPRMTKCGHVFCFPCILHYLSTSADLKWVRCPICFDSVNERQLKAVVWTDAPLHFDDESDEPHAEASSSSASLDAAPSPTPQPGSMLRMRLMQRPQITTLALPRSATWPSDLLPPHQAPFHFLPDVYAFAKFMLATPSYLVEYLTRDVAELAAERRMLDSMSDPIGMAFVDAAEQRLQAQIEKAKALDTEPLRDAIDKALQLQHEIEARASHHQQRRKLEQEIPATETDVPEAYLATRSPAPTTPRVPTPVTPNARNSKQRRNVNPPPPSTSTYYYYQAASGTPVFLHPLDIKILHAHFNGYASFPDTIAVRVEAHSEGAVNDELRKRCKYLAHMPAGADVVFVEADLSGAVGADGLRAFEGALKARRAKREGKGRKDDRARARAEEREREKLAQASWRETGHVPAYLAPAPAAEGAAEAEPPSAPAPVSGAWGARSFASAAHAGGGGGRAASLRPSARRAEEEDEWDLDIAWHEMEARSAGGGGGGRRNRRSRPMVVLGSGPGRRR